MNRLVSSFLIGLALAGAAGAQTPPADLSAKLREVLPADVAERVLAKIAAARARELPAAALENRALKFAARGVNPEDIERSVADQSLRMEQVKVEIGRSRRDKAVSPAEIDAGAEAMRMGVDGSKISELARSAPSGRSLEVPLLVIGSLVDRGLPSDEAMRRVLDRLNARASDRDIERIPGEVASRRPGEAGRQVAGTKRPTTPVVNRPAGVAPNAGAGTRPTSGKMPESTKRPTTTTKRP